MPTNQPRNKQGQFIRSNMIIVEDILKNPNYNPKNSYQWFLANVTNLAKQRNVKKMDVLSQNQKRQTKQILPGKMFAYFYDPIHKDTLPYYDKFPLILPFAVKKPYFWGLNMHYLPPKIRLVLLNKLIQLSDSNQFTEQTKIQISWKILKNASKFPEIKPCIKQYHMGHVKSMFVEFPIEQWPIMIFLPVVSWAKGADDEKVFKDSLRIING